MLLSLTQFGALTHPWNRNKTVSHQCVTEWSGNVLFVIKIIKNHPQKLTSTVSNQTPEAHRPETVSQQLCFYIRTKPEYRVLTTCLWLLMWKTSISQTQTVWRQVASQQVTLAKVAWILAISPWHHRATADSCPVWNKVSAPRPGCRRRNLTTPTNVC